MFCLIAGIFTRIFSNSFLNVFQKLLTASGERPSVINFYTYLGLAVIAFIVSPVPIYKEALLINVLIMGVLGALGNYFIIKALSKGDLSELAPINSYKPVVALVFGCFLLKEFPHIKELLGIFLIILGTFILFNKKIKHSKALLYRVLALIFSGVEAIFIKKVILLSSINSAFFYWALAGFVFSLFLTLKKDIKISKVNIKYQFLLILAVGVMQYSTNYVFSKINVAYALALFQLSTVVSVFLGANIFHEQGLKRKLIASFVMIFGAIMIILN